MNELKDLPVLKGLDVNIMEYWELGYDLFIFIVAKEFQIKDSLLLPKKWTKSHPDKLWASNSPGILKNMPLSSSYFLGLKVLFNWDFNNWVKV